MGGTVHGHGLQDSGVGKVGCYYVVAQTPLARNSRIVPTTTITTATVRHHYTRIIKSCCCCCCCFLSPTIPRFVEVRVITRIIPRKLKRAYKTSEIE